MQFLSHVSQSSMLAKRKKDNTMRKSICITVNNVSGIKIYREMFIESYIDPFDVSSHPNHLMIIATGVLNSNC
jgi:hypothetical protein